MQFINALIAGAAVASAAVIPARDTPPQEFDITVFGMSGTPHSVIAEYSMNVTKNDGSTPVPIKCETRTNTSPSLSPFPLNACSDVSWSWSWTSQNTSQGTGYSLKLTHLTTYDPMNNQTACLWMPSSVIKTFENPGGPTGNVDYVDYSNNFTMTWSFTNECVYN